MAESTLKEKTAKGLFWGGLSSGILQVLGAVFGIFLARLLSIEDYGLVGMLAIFTSIASAIINSGFSVALTNKKEASHKEYNAVFWFTVFVALLLYVILFLSAPLIASFYKHPELTALSRVLFISFVFGGIATVPYTVLFKRMMVKEQAIIDILSVVLSGGVGILMAVKGYAYWALVMQSVVYISVNSLLKCIISPWRPTLDIDFSPIKEMLPFSIRIFFTHIFFQVNTNIFSLILGKLYDATQVGLYSQGYKWMNMGYSVLSGMITSVAQPVLVQVREEKERLSYVFRKMIRFGAFLSFPLMLGLAFIAPEFIHIALGVKWLPSVPFLQLFCLWGAFGFLWNLYTNLIISHGRSNIYMYGMIVVGLLQLAAIIACSPLGIMYMVAGYVLMFYIGLLIWHYHAAKMIEIRLRDILKDILPYLLISLFSFLIAWAVSTLFTNIYLVLTAKVGVSVLVYVLIMKYSQSKIFSESVAYLLKLKK